MLDESRELLKGNTPTLILAVLRDGPLHGYGIAKEIEHRSSSALKYKEGTLYPALHGLERDELVAADWQVEANGRKRKTYRITLTGLTELERREALWHSFASAIQSVLGGGDNGRAADESPTRKPGRKPRAQPAT